jgi:peptidoglycan hydrolase-like protein with peptidoglycan-binding domain
MCKESSPICALKPALHFGRRRIVLAIAAFLVPSGISAALAFDRSNDQLRNASPELIRALQRRLKELNFSIQIADGVWSNQTAAAFAEFCRVRRLESNRLTREHIRALWNEDVDPKRPSLDFLRRIGIAY